MLKCTNFTKLVTPSWLVSLWKGSCQFSIQLRMSQDIIKSSKQLNDRSITEEVTNNSFSMEQRVATNRVQITLRVFFVSDLMFLGKSIVKTCYEEGIEDVGLVSVHH